MASLNDLYTYYCRRCDCRPNSQLSVYLEQEYARHGGERVLEVLDLSSNYLGAKGVIPLLDLVKNTKSVTTLNLSNNMLEHEQLEHLVYCLVLHPSITTVVLRNNCLHDGSLGSILSLLERNHCITTMELEGNSFLPSSMALVRAQLERNKVTLEKIAAESTQVAEIRAANAKRGCFAEAHDTVSESSSGGHIHFATWWRNPQYVLQISRSSRVRITLTVKDGTAALQVGFFVMRFDGVRRVVEVDQHTVVKESPVSAGSCCVEVSLEASGHYVVMPFTFHPGRAMTFTLRAQLIDDKPTLAEGWLTLDRMDARYDWFHLSVRGRWIGETAGGGGDCRSWKRNDMYHLLYSGKRDSFLLSSTAIVCIQLSKHVDPDHNDEKAIGFHVMDHDVYAQGRPSLVCSQDLVRFRVIHERRTTVFLRFSVRVSDLDYFIVPSTMEAQQYGDYTMTVFSTVPIECTPSYFPHSWNYRVMEGVWDQSCCGGCREENRSWKNNPAIELVLDKGRVTKPMSFFLEPISAAPTELVSAPVEEGVATENNDGEESDETSVDSVTAQRLAEEQAFLARHMDGAVEVSITAVDASPPKYVSRQTSPHSATESYLRLADTTMPFYVVPMTRRAGQLGAFRLHIFADEPFVVGSAVPLAVLERQSQLDEYQQENAARKQNSFHPQQLPNTPNGVHETSGQMSDGMCVQGQIIRHFLSTDQKYMDRDFPRGASSLWLDPEARPPGDFPKNFEWRRSGEVSPQARCLLGHQLSSPFPYSKRQWFASVIQALAAKPMWLSRIFSHYDRTIGFAQFRFWKAGHWIDVTVDDFLTVDAAGELCFGHSMDTNDFFFPLVEKAFAKLHRCYEALEPKVTPELRLLDMLQQGLTDVSGGLSTTLSLEGDVGAVMTDMEKDSLWSRLKESTKSSVLFSLILRSDSPRASGRKHGGILPDHLYGIMDARFIEQQRLVKLRNWSEGVSTTWRGKWAPHSNKWTDTLLQVLEYDHSQDVIWLSFDEVLYYFTDVIFTEEYPNVTFIEGDFAARELLDTGVDARLCHPQFSLIIDNPPADNTPVEVTIGLHQPDARMSITRAKEATATYRNAVGLLVFDTEDNLRQLKQVRDDQVLRLVTPVRARDLFCRVAVHPNEFSAHKLTIMPFPDHERAGSSVYQISAWSPHAVVRVLPVQDSNAHRVCGSWNTFSAGGSPAHATWRDNPHFFLSPSETTEVTLFLHPRTQAAAKVGFSVHTTKCCRSFLAYDPSTVVHMVAPASQPFVSCTLQLYGMQERKGMPYVIVPFCDEPGVLGDFVLEAVANRKLQLAPVEPRLDWQREVRTVKLRTADGSAGGGPRFPSWRCNPQLVLDFPVEREGHLLISAANDRKGDTRNEIGMLLLRAEPRWDNGRRRRLLYNPEDVVMSSLERSGQVEMEVDVNMRDNKDPLILVVYTLMPYQEMDISLSIYSALTIQVTPVNEWRYVALVEDSWELGQTAGGSRREYKSWINNPFVALSTIRSTQVVALLLQYPRGPEKPIVKRCGNVKAYLPPPIVNLESRMAIELDLVHYDETLTPIAHAGPSKYTELTLVADVEASQEKPYLLVPSTSIPEQNGDLKLWVFADHPIDLYSIAKPRLPYI